ncbi:hypothetical protein NLG97_g4411 [Lecanicillium saksenae]|uniref:Uncharacterized protein n=1 Tax=Lecanicillium saksenae TaxID=468837 RepID=A0ACC1QWJ4_9HYPO|nr:hypothetical protein NLG97_g4411 [Lecanicillium saksenae]
MVRPVVRLGPNEVSVTDLDAIKAIYGTKPTFQKSNFYRRIATTGQQSLFTTVDPDYHHRHRRLLASPLSEASLKSMIPQVEARVSLAIQRIREETKSRGAADVFKWWRFMTTDVIGELTFGESFRMLELGHVNEYSRDLERITKVGALRATFPALVDFSWLVPVPAFRDALKHDMNMRGYAAASVQRYKDLVKADPDNAPETLFRYMYSAEERGEIPFNELRDQAQSYLAAGTVTTAISLTYLTWAVCRHPEIQAELVKALQALPGEFTDTELRKLPLLNHIIDEALRLHSAAPSPLPRVVPAGGALVAGYWLDEGTEVSTQAYGLHRDPEIFPQPEEFIPSRWEAPTEAMLRSYMPLGRGPRMCLGQFLARIELRLAVARFFLAFPHARMSSLEGMSDKDMDPRVYVLLIPAGARCLIEALNTKYRAHLVHSTAVPSTMWKKMPKKSRLGLSFFQRIFSSPSIGALTAHQQGEAPTESSNWSMLLERYAPEFIWVCTMPYNGAYAIRMFPAEEFAGMLARGEKIAVSQAVTCSTRHYMLTELGSPTGEFYLQPDCASAYMNPSPTERRLEVMASWVHKDGRPVAVCPRNTLQRLSSHIRNEYGLQVLLGFEIEVVFMATSADADMAGPDAMVTLAEEICRALLRAGVSVRLFHAETAHNQWEFVLGPNTPVEAVDQLVQARRIIFFVARSLKWKATLHPRPVATEAGTGAHVHVSVNRQEDDAAAAVLHAEDFDHQLSFFAGILHRLRALCAFTMPLDVSYDRVQHGIWSGGEYVCWGWHNRETPMRRVENNRFEMKTVCGTANPYIAMAAILAAGSIGLRERLRLTLLDCPGDPSNLSPGKRQALGISATFVNMNMTRSQTTRINAPATLDPLAVAVGLLMSCRSTDYFAYEIEDTWHIGIHCYASLVIDSQGKYAHKQVANGNRVCLPVQDRPLNDIARGFCSEYSKHGKIFGQVAFNFSAHVAGQSYIPGSWPLLSLMVPGVHMAICSSHVTVHGNQGNSVEGFVDLICSQLNDRTLDVARPRFLPVAVGKDSDGFQERVKRAVANIKAAKYTMAIPSRVVHVPSRLDMLATLYHGRRANTPRRAFTFRHGEFEATGFSPEVVLSFKDGTVFTEALAGTQTCEKAASKPLHDDPKEVMEHLVAVRGAMRRLRHICEEGTVVISELMSTVTRGNVCHLYSRISGSVLQGKSGWDSIRCNITVPALPKERNAEAIEAFEPMPRELYGGSIVMVDGEDTFEAALVLRTVFQDQNRKWLQAGAGITALSDPVREFTETCEKLASIAPYLQRKVSLVDRFVDDVRPLRLAIIGGGVAGILAGILLPAKVEHLSLTIFEKNADLGGTWLENVYPGVRCDTPAHAYQATFCHKTDWSETFPPGSEILQYWQSLALKHGVYEAVRLRHKVEAAEWDGEACRWTLKVRNLDEGHSVTEVFDFVLTCAGRLNAWKLPDYPGLEDYKGVLRHTWNWDTSFDCEGRTVAVIGNGASGVQVVPNLQKVVSHLYHFARSSTWVGPTAGEAPSTKAETPPQVVDERPNERKWLSEYLSYRKGIEDRAWRGFRGFLRGSAENKGLQDRFTVAIRKHLKARPDILENFIPPFAPNCRRQTQGPGRR